MSTSRSALSAAASRLYLASLILAYVAPPSKMSCWMVMLAVFELKMLDVMPPTVVPVRVCPLLRFALPLALICGNAALLAVSSVAPARSSVARANSSCGDFCTAIIFASRSESGTGDAALGMPTAPDGVGTFAGMGTGSIVGSGIGLGIEAGVGVGVGVGRVDTAAMAGPASTSTRTVDVMARRQVIPFPLLLLSVSDGRVRKSQPIHFWTFERVAAGHTTGFTEKFVRKPASSPPARRSRSRPNRPATRPGAALSLAYPARCRRPPLCRAFAGRAVRELISPCRRSPYRPHCRSQS